MSEKRLDNKGRWRSKDVGFRLSPEEADLLNKYVALSGLTKREYIANRVLNMDIIVYPNPRVYKALRNSLNDVYEVLIRINNSGEISTELLSTIQFIANMLYQINNDERNNNYGRQKNNDCR